MYVLLGFANRWIVWYIPLLIPFSTISNISLLANSFNSTFVFLKAACHASSGTELKWTENNLYISVHLFWKFSNISVCNDVSLWMYKLLQILSKLFSHVCYLHQQYIPCLEYCGLQSGLVISSVFRLLRNFRR